MKTQYGIGVACVLLSALITAPVSAQSTQPAGAPQPAMNAPLNALHRQLNQLLGPDGTLREANDRNTAALAQIAGRASQLARAADEPAAQLRARRHELRAIHGLTQSALANNRSIRASLGLTQLRRTAEQTRALKTPEATAVADFWQLNAELIDIRRNSDDADETAQKIIDHLEQFIRQRIAAPESTNDPSETSRRAVSPAVIYARRALLRLYDQTGRTADAKQLLGTLMRPLPSGHTWTQIALAAQRHGKGIDLTTQTRNGAWSLRNQRGAFVIVHFYYRAQGIDDPTAAALKRAQNAMGDRLRVLQVVVGHATATAPDDDNVADARVTEISEAKAIARKLGVIALPRLVIIDPNGQHVAAGTSSGVVDRLTRGELVERAPQTQPGEQ